MSTLNVTTIQHESASGNNIVLDSDGNVTCAGDVQAASFNGGASGGFRNQLINSGFQIDQRGLSGTELSGTKYCLDRWVAASGATVTKLNVNPGGLPNAISYVDGNTPGYMRQAIELGITGQSAPFNTPDLDWTFSVYSDTAPEFEAFYADENTALDNRTDWVDLTDMTSTGKTIRTNKTGTLTQYSITINSSPGPASTNKCLVIAWRGGGFYAGPQFEPGPVATPFEHRPIGTELALCQRYYLQTTNQHAIWTGMTVDGKVYSVSADYPVQMRVIPTIDKVTSQNRQDFVTPELNVATINSATFKGTASATVDGNYYWVGFTADAEL